MLKIFAVAATAVVATLTVACLPAKADQSVASQVVFGKIYNDGVTAIHVLGPNRRTLAGMLPLSVTVATPASKRREQAEASADPRVMDALAARHIELQNVIEVQTAANGGKIIYYR
ncbi:hypothetical protein [Rhizobium halophytocola]|uniref:Uncharacterized protein n=1 Tax=Rhizobium halophytocola TaxID=735519 RepID=A0ABS4DZZ9_9HYPH|nr:hypothetical protein [Rhizobium halophytocola]MBP1851264.1 hypothetical protein [Rhizobium halophytocola]